MNKTSNRIIAILTDFGNQDQYVGVMKGEILKINPIVDIIDITHNVESQNIRKAAFILKNTYKSFPGGTIFLCVVDPGVGSSRMGLIAKINNQYFVCPDNGILSYIIHVENSVELYEIDVENFTSISISNTFHGRDIFAPTAAEISLNNNLGTMANKLEIKDIILLSKPLCEIDGKDIRSEVINIDRYGNIVLSIDSNHIGKYEFSSIVLDSISDIEIPFDKYYSQVKKDRFIAYIGSTDNVEIAINCGNAATYFGLAIGDTIKLLLIS